MIRKSKVEMMNNILNDLFDIIIKMVQIGVEVLIDIWKNIALLWKDDIVELRDDEIKMWNGGDTFHEESVESTESPMDNIIYDGMMGEIDDNG